MQKKYLLIIILSILVFGCTKEDGDVGLGIQPTDDLLNFEVSEDFPVKTYCVEDDSIITNSFSQALLGSYLDPQFGEVKSSFYTQFKLASENVDFTPTNGGTLNDIVLDSVVLSLSYSELSDPNYYGKLDPQTFEVFELTQSIPEGTIYSFSSFSNNGMNLATSVMPIAPNVTDSVHTVNGSFPAQLRIRLDNSFGQKIINESGNATLANNDTTSGFLSFIKGLYVTTNNTQASGEGGVFYLNLSSSNSQLTLYYRDTSATGVANHDTLAFNFIMDTSCNRSNEISFNHSPDIQNQLSDSSLGQNITYNQAGGSVKTIIEIDSIKERFDTLNIIPNRAELIVPVDDNNSDYPPAANMVLANFINGEEGILADGFVIGVYDESNKEYIFNIPRTVSQIINGMETNSKFSLFSNSRGVLINRTIIFGAENTQRKTKLRVYYTKR